MQAHSTYRVSIPIVIGRYPELRKEDWLAELRRAGADRVFLVPCRSTDAEAEKTRQAHILSELIPYFTAAGLEVGVWIITLGHGAPSGGEHLPYARITGLGGETASDTFCPLDPAFGDGFAAWVGDIARAGARMIMLDDDYRLSYRRGNVGCTCDLHLAAVARLTGETLDRSELANRAFTGGPNRYRDAWLQAGGDSLRHLAGKLRAAVDAVDPSIRLGHCACLSTWDIDGVDSIELAKIFAGRTRPFLRCIGAPYWAVGQSWGFRLGSIIEVERLQRKWCEEEDIEIFSEGDSYPRPRFNAPASYVEGFDMAMRADGGMDGILKYMLDYHCSARHETGYIDRHVRHQPLYAEIAKHFAGKPAAGVRVFEAMHKLSQSVLPDTRPSGAWIQETFVPASSRFLCDNAVPMQYDVADATIIFGESARHADAATLAHGAILDAPAAAILSQRGFDVGLRRVLGPAMVESEYYPDQDELVPISGRHDNLELDPRATLVTNLRGRSATGGAYHYEDARGCRFLVYPFHGFEVRNNRDQVFRSYCRARQLATSLAYLRRRPMAAVCQGNPDLYLMCKQDADSLSVGLWNFFADDIATPTIALGETYEAAEFINCTGRLHGREVVLSAIAPFAFAAVVLRGRRS